MKISDHSVALRGLLFTSLLVMPVLAQNEMGLDFEELDPTERYLEALGNLDLDPSDDIGIDPTRDLREVDDIVEQEEFDPTTDLFPDEGSDDLELKFNNSETGFTTSERPVEEGILDFSVRNDFLDLDRPFRDLFSEGRPPTRWTFNVRTGVFYNDNIFITPDNQVGDMVFFINPNIGITLGDVERRESFLSLNYAPNAQIFADNSSESTVNHSARVQGEAKFARVTLGTNTSFVSERGSDSDVGLRVDRQSINSTVFARYTLSDIVTLQLDGNVEDESIGNGLGSTELFVGAEVDYEPNEVWALGLRGEYGQLDFKRGGSQDFSRYFLTGAYNLTGKIALEAQVGADVRRSDINPVFRAGIVARPFVGTEIRLQGFREVDASSSSSDNEIADRTGVRIQAAQRITDRFQVAVETGYSNSQFDGNNGVSSRSDDFFFVRPSLAYRFGDQLTAELFYSYRRNDSTSENLNWKENQTGISLEYRY